MYDRRSMTCVTTGRVVADQDTMSPIQSDKSLPRRWANETRYRDRVRSLVRRKVSNSPQFHYTYFALLSVHCDSMVDEGGSCHWRQLCRSEDVAGSVETTWFGAADRLAGWAAWGANRDAGIFLKGRTRLWERLHSDVKSRIEALKRFPTPPRLLQCIEFAMR